MPLIVKNTKELINSENLKLKILLIAMPGFGKTSFLADSLNPGIGVCETGHGDGLLSIASSGVDYTELDSYDDFDAFCSGMIFKDKDTLCLDSLSDMTQTFIKDKALSLPRAKGESQKRQLGVPELDDYGVMGELTRKLLRKLLNFDKHIIVTCGLRIDKPDPETGQGEMLCGPALPGQLFIGSTAMFDLVLLGRTRWILKDPKDAKSKFNQRYWLTEPTQGFLAKNRLSLGNDGTSFLPKELIYDRKINSGTFDDILKKAQTAYTNELIKRNIKP